MIKSNSSFLFNDWTYQTNSRVNGRVLFVDVILNHETKEFNVFSGKTFIGSGSFKRIRPSGAIVNKIVKNFINDNDVQKWRK